MIGISHTINLIDSEPTAEQTAVYTVLARTLRDMKYEHIIFDFQSCESPGENTGLIILQMCRDSDHMYVEVRIDCLNMPQYHTIRRDVTFFHHPRNRPVPPESGNRGE